MSIDKDTAARVANLARISIPDEELENVAKELSNIIGFMEQLNEVNVDNVEPMTSVTPTVLKKRTDVVNDGNQQSKVLSNAPDTREGFLQSRKWRINK